MAETSFRATSLGSAFVLVPSLAARTLAAGSEDRVKIPYAITPLNAGAGRRVILVDWPHSATNARG